MIPHVEDYKGGKEEQMYYDDLKTNKVSWQHQLLLNRPLKVIIALLLSAVLAPLLIYNYIFMTSIDFPPSDGYSFGSCLLAREARLACGLGDVNETDCHSQCCYDLDNHFCFHRFPSRFTYLTPLDQEWNEEIILQPRVSTVPYKFQQSLPQIKVCFDETSETHLSLNFYNPQEKSMECRKLTEKQYSYEVWSPEFNIIVNGTEGNNTIFNTMRGPFVASNDIWEISFVLTDETMYGLGEIPLKMNTTKILYNHAGGLNSIPLIFAKSRDQYHGLLIDITEPTEVTIRGNNQINVRALTKSGLKFHLLVGPQPEDIMRDVTALIGAYESLEYWMLGIHICSELSTDTKTSYNNLEEFLSRSSVENIPFDSHCGVQPIIFQNQRVNSGSENLETGSDLLMKYNKKYVPHVSPYISYDVKSDTEDSERDASYEIKEKFKEFMLKDTDGNIYIGSVDNQTFVYPDYENVTTEFMETLWNINSTIHGLVLENSWPTDDSYKDLTEMYNSLPYFTEAFEGVFEVTPRWNIKRSNGEQHLYTHNAYGNHFSQAFHKIFNNGLPISSSSQWMTGKMAVNVQNIDASWANLQKVLTEAALAGISGQKLFSAPVCGDTDNFDPSLQTNLCIKWYLAAAYLPMMKIHSRSIERSPLAFIGIGTNKNNIIKALHHRLTLLPYFFTTLQEGPLIRPMFYQYPYSENLKDLTSQFNVGADLLIVPNLLPNQSHVHVWLPPGTWYELWSGYRLNGAEGQAVTMTTTEADLLTLLRGGSIITLQKEVKLSSEETRLNSSFSLIIALNCNSNEISVSPECEASGHLYIDENISITYTANSDKILIEIKNTRTTIDVLCDSVKAVWTHVIKEIYVYGLSDEFNNNDNYRKIDTNIDFCILESETSISYSLN